MWRTWEAWGWDKDSTGHREGWRSAVEPTELRGWALRCLSPGLMFLPCRGDRDVTHSKEAGICHLSFVKGDNSEASGALASNS